MRIEELEAQVVELKGERSSNLKLILEGILELDKRWLRIEELEAKIKELLEIDECWTGCGTGDCPHRTVQECADALVKVNVALIRENELPRTQLAAREPNENGRRAQPVIVEAEKQALATERNDLRAQVAALEGEKGRLKVDLRRKQLQVDNCVRTNGARCLIDGVLPLLPVPAEPEPVGCPSARIEDEEHKPDPLCRCGHVESWHHYHGGWCHNLKCLCDKFVVVEVESESKIPADGS